MTSPLCKQTHPLTSICRRFAMSRRVRGPVSRRCQRTCAAPASVLPATADRPNSYRYLGPAVIASTASEQS